MLFVQKWLVKGLTIDSALRVGASRTQYAFLYTQGHPENFEVEIATNTKHSIDRASGVNSSTSYGTMTVVIAMNLVSIVSI